MKTGVIDSTHGMSTEAIDRKYNVRPFVDAPVVRENVNPLTLDAIDLSLFQDGPEFLQQRKDLAKALSKSITTYGFFNIVNFGFPKGKIDHLRSISQSVLELPYEIQLKYLASAARKEDELPGSIGGERGQGFKPKGYWAIKDGVRDSISLYNMRDIYHDSFLEHPERHPEILLAHLAEFEEYFSFLRRNVLEKLLRLCDLVLGVEEGSLAKFYFANAGTNKDDSGSRGRLMLYLPYKSEESSNNTDNMYLRGHSDISGFSFITSQPILALQIKDVFTGEWRYVNHRPDSLIVNCGDAMEFITGGYFKACMHRVVEPPNEQLAYDRLVLIFFSNPSSDAIMDPEQLQSPVLNDLGYTKSDKLKEWEKIDFEKWNSTKGPLLGKTAAGKANLLQVYGRLIERWHHFRKA